MDDALTRILENLIGRVHGPMHLRVFMQPAMAILIAARDGHRDAREGQPAFGYALFTDAGHRRRLLQDGWKSIGKVFVAAFLLDGVYQFVVLKWYYPGEGLLVPFLLAVTPYLLVRGPINRLLGWRRARRG